MKRKWLPVNKTRAKEYKIVKGRWENAIRNRRLRAVFFSFVFIKCIKFEK